MECALKACIAKQFRRYGFPEKKLVNDSYTHDLRKLLGLVQDVKAELEKELKSNSSFNVNWNTVIQWDEDARYVANVTQALATNLYTAIADQSNGVLTWLKKYW